MQDWKPGVDDKYPLELGSEYDYELSFILVDLG